MSKADHINGVRVNNIATLAVDWWAVTHQIHTDVVSVI